MESHKLAVKLFVELPSDLKSDAFIPVFHGWIQRHALADHLLIDVADYKHVPDGPGTVLVSHEANLSTDQAGGRLGLLYFRKQPFISAETFAERLRATFRATLEAAALLEQEQGFVSHLRFRTDEVVFRIHDRLLAPNNAQTLAEIQDNLQAFLWELYAEGPIAIEQYPDPRSVFQVTLKGPQRTDVASLLQRASAGASASK